MCADREGASRKYVSASSHSSILRETHPGLGVDLGAQSAGQDSLADKLCAELETAPPTVTPLLGLSFTGG